MSIRRHLPYFAPLLGLFISPWRSAFADAALHDLKIGVVLPLSGPMGPYGREVLNGLDLALDDIKKKDPALAGRLQVIRKDDKSIVKDAEEIARDLYNVQRVHILLGSLTSSTTIPLTNVATFSEKPLVTPTATNNLITHKGQFVFRTCYNDSFQGAIMAKFALKSLNAQRAAIIYDKTSDYARSLALEFERFYSMNGGTVSGRIEYQAGASDFTQQLQQIKRKAPQAIFAPGYYQEVGKMIAQGRQLGITAPFIGGDGWDHPRLYQLAANNLQIKNYYLAPFFADDPSEGTARFVSLYQAKFAQKPSILAALGYDSVMVVSDAFKRAGTNSSASLSQALATTKDVQGVAGTISLNAGRDAVRTVVILSTEAAGPKFHAKLNLN